MQEQDKEIRYITSVRHVVVDGFASITFTERHSVGVTLHRFLDDILQRLILCTISTYLLITFGFCLSGQVFRS